MYRKFIRGYFDSYGLWGEGRKKEWVEVNVRLL